MTEAKSEPTWEYQVSDDFSIRVSRKREDARRVKDHRALFSSNSPSIHPIQTGLVRNGTPVNTTIFQHNLGYRPFFLIFRKGALNSQVPNFATGAASFQLNDRADWFRVDRERLYLADNGGSGIEVDYYYAIFDINLDEEFESNIETSGDRDGGGISGDDFAFRITDRHSIGSPDPRDFSVNTDFQPLFLHKVAYLENPVNEFKEFEVEHDLGYPPMFYIFGTFFDEPEYYELFSIGPAGSYVNFADVDDRVFRMGITIPFRAAIVILKDPIL